MKSINQILLKKFKELENKRDDKCQEFKEVNNIDWHLLRPNLSCLYAEYGLAVPREIFNLVSLTNEKPKV